MTRIFAVLLIVMLFFASCKNPNAEIKQSKNSNATIESLSAEIRENPENASLFIQRSELQSAAGNVNEAINDLEIALRIDSLLPNVYVDISEYYLSVGASGKAKDVLIKCIDIFPANADARLKLAQIYFYVQMYKEAINEIITLENNKLQSAESYFVKALVFNETESFDEATLALKKSIEFDGENWEAYNLIGMIYYRLGDPIAVEYFNTAVILFPNNLEIRFNAGVVYQNFKIFDKAITEYDYVISADSLSYQAYFNLAYIYVNNMEDYEQAVENFSYAFNTDTTSYKAIYNRGYTYELLGKYKLAELDYRKALEILPNYDLAVQGLNDVIAKQF